MKTATLEEVHADPHCLDRWTEAGEPVMLTRNGEPVAEFVPKPRAAATTSGTIQWPDFLGRARRRQELYGPSSCDFSTIREANERRFP